MSFEARITTSEIKKFKRQRSELRAGRFSTITFLLGAVGSIAAGEPVLASLLVTPAMLSLVFSAVLAGKVDAMKAELRLRIKQQKAQKFSTESSRR